MYASHLQRSPWLASAPMIKEIGLWYTLIGIIGALTQHFSYSYFETDFGAAILLEQIAYYSMAFLLFGAFLLTAPMYLRQTQWLAKMTLPAANHMREITVSLSVRAACLLSGVASITMLLGDVKITITLTFMALYFFAFAEFAANIHRLRDPSQLLFPAIGILVGMPFSSL